MKKIIQFSLILISFTIFNVNFSYGVPRNVVFEFVTGTWCQYCPCGHTTVDALRSAYPTTIFIGYHGPANTPSDPWSVYNGNEIISLTGYTGYPTAIVDRQSGSPTAYTTWANKLVTRYSLYPESNLELTITNKSFNTVTRQLSATINAKPLINFSGQYKIKYLIIEDNLLYNQTGNSGCTGGGATYVHEDVVRTIINGATGENINTTTNWNANETISKDINYTLNANWIPQNCKLVAFVYLDNGAIISSTVEQGISIPVDGPTNINPIASSVTDYKLSQNYPNPFNPTTNINFTVPKDMNVSLKVYDAKGTEVAVLANGFVKKGTYNALFEGAGLSSGIYFYKLIAGDFVDTKKMVLNK